MDKRSIVISAAIIIGSILLMYLSEVLQTPHDHGHENRRHKKAAHLSENIHSSSHEHEEVREITGEVPRVQLEVQEVGDGKVKIYVHVTGFSFEQKKGESINELVGHAHLYVDSKMKAMFYTPEYELVGLKPGKHIFKVVLSDKNHLRLVHGGEPVGDTADIVIK